MCSLYSLIETFNHSHTVGDLRHFISRYPFMYYLLSTYMLLLGVCTFSGVARGGGKGGAGLGNLILYPDYLQVTSIMALLCHCSTSKTIMILEPQPKNSSPLPRAGTRWLKYGLTLGQRHFVHLTECSGLIPRLYISLWIMRQWASGKWVCLKRENDNWEHREGMSLVWNGFRINFRRWKISRLSRHTLPRTLSQKPPQH